jgi:hypothetical protein
MSSRPTSATLNAPVNESTMMSPKTISEKRSSGLRMRVRLVADVMISAAGFEILDRVSQRGKAAEPEVTSRCYRDEIGGLAVGGGKEVLPARSRQVGSRLKLSRHPRPLEAPFCLPQHEFTQALEHLYLEANQTASAAARGNKRNWRECVIKSVEQVEHELGP